MGCAVPYAIGAKFAHPDRPVIALVGDGAMQMNGLAELITIKHYWQQWTDPRLVIAVLHNNDLNQVTWELRGMGGAPKFVESQALPAALTALSPENVRSAGLQKGLYPENVRWRWSVPGQDHDAGRMSSLRRGGAHLGRAGSRVPGRTNSSAIIAPRPRISPITAWRAAIQGGGRWGHT